MSTERTDAEPGAQLDGFIVEQRLRGGGMGILFRVSKPGSDRPLLMKLPRAGRGEAAEAILALETEALIVPLLRRPHVPAFTARAHKTERASRVSHFQRFFRAGAEHGARLRAPAALLSRTPSLLVAVDTEHPDDERHGAIQLAVRQILQATQEFRLICLTVTASGDAALLHRARLRE